jgi:hypothetical protein
LRPTPFNQVLDQIVFQGLVTNLIYKAESMRSSLLHHLIPVSDNLGGGKIEADTQLFEPGALPTGEGSSVNTYKDIVDRRPFTSGEGPRFK